jgi:hypothetical protein
LLLINIFYSTHITVHPPYYHWIFFNRLTLFIYILLFPFTLHFVYTSLIIVLNLLFFFSSFLFICTTYFCALFQMDFHCTSIQYYFCYSQEIIYKAKPSPLLSKYLFFTYANFYKFLSYMYSSNYILCYLVNIFLQ